MCFPGSVRRPALSACLGAPVRGGLPDRIRPRGRGQTGSGLPGREKRIPRRGRIPPERGGTDSRTAARAAAPGRAGAPYRPAGAAPLPGSPPPTARKLRLWRAGILPFRGCVFRSPSGRKKHWPSSPGQAAASAGSRAPFRRAPRSGFPTVPSAAPGLRLPADSRCLSCRGRGDCGEAPAPARAAGRRAAENRGELRGPECRQVSGGFSGLRPGEAAPPGGQKKSRERFRTPGNHFLSIFFPCF